MVRRDKESAYWKNEILLAKDERKVKKNGKKFDGPTMVHLHKKLGIDEHKFC